MNVHRFRTVALLLLFVTAPLLLLAQSTTTPPPPAPGQRMYNPGTETTLKGTVEEVLTQAGKRGRSGIHLNLKVDQQIYNVHVGPSFYISAQQFSFAKGDTLEVTGSKIGADTLIAREIVKDGKTLTLRDSQGLPKWRRGATP